MNDAEMLRILSLRAEPPSAIATPYTLRPAQARCLAEWVRALRAPAHPWGPPGLAALLGCGHGKTLVSLLLAPVAASVTGRPLRALHLVPASLVPQLHSDAAAWGLELGDVVSHESLSAPRGRHVLRSLAPDLVIIDEAHAFANPESGRWRRITEYLVARPDVRIAVLSGSLTWRSLRQARHLLLAALRGWCPLPADRTLDHWAAVIDAGSDPCEDDRRVLAPLLSWAEVDDARAAYHARLRSCPGVVLTSDVGVSASLHLTARTTASPPPAIRDAVDRLESRWELPDETQLVSALEVARHASTIGLGLYQRWAPDTVDPMWVDRRRAWGGVVRSLVAYHGGRYQTPAAVEAAAREGALDTGAMHAWNRWQAVAGQPEPEIEEVWLPGADEHIAETIRAWGPAHDALIWVTTPALGDRLARLLGVRYHGAGSTPPTGGLAVASMRVHGTGWDGAPRAGYRRALVLEVPSSAATWEQTLARLHRPGATDTVEVDIVLGTSIARGALGAAIEGATYIRDTTGSAQRLLEADWTGWYVPRRKA